MGATVGQSITVEDPRVSVVINFLNAESFVEEAIESVLVQTYENWELLLVDDGSTDGSTRIAQGYAARFPGRVRYLEHEGHRNRGSSASRNLGMRKAHGELVAFLDADDVWFSDKLRGQVELLDRLPEAAMVIGPARVWHSWSGASATERDHDNVPAYAADALVAPPQIVHAQLLNGGDAPFPSGMLIRRSLAEEVGGFEENFRGMHDDQVFCTKLCLIHTVYAQRHPVFLYRIHPDSLCQTSIASGHYAGAKQRYLEWLESFLDGRVAKDSDLWRELQERLWPYRHPILHRAARFRSRLRRKAARLVSSAARWVLPSGARGWVRERFGRAKR